MAEAEKRMIQDDILSDDMLMVASGELFKRTTALSYGRSDNELCPISEEPKVVGSMGGDHLSGSEDVSLVVVRLLAVMGRFFIRAG